MNLKTILSLTTLSAATAACAVTTDNTLCRIEVASGTKNTIVSVPLKTVAGSDEKIKLTDLVLTDNLANGDYLLHKGASGWESWIVEDGKWTSVAVSEAGVTTITGSDKAFPRGDAFWLVRSDASKSFYLYGEVIDTDATAPTIVKGAYTMMGNTALAPVAINDLTFSGTTQPKTGDKIAVATTKGIGAKEYTYDEDRTAWTEATLALDANGVLNPTVKVTTATIPAGQGFWYISK